MVHYQLCIIIIIIIICWRHTIKRSRWYMWQLLIEGIAYLMDLQTSKACVSSAKECELMLYLDAIEPISVINWRKSKGSFTEPCGTMQRT